MVFDLPAPVDYNEDYTIETLVVADKKMTDFHGVEELKVYVPSLVNIVSSPSYFLQKWFVSNDATDVQVNCVKREAPKYSEHCF